MYNNHVDFYLSFGIGLAFAIFFISLAVAFRPLVNKLRKGEQREETTQPSLSFLERLRVIRTRSKDRGDISIFVALGIYIFSTITYISVCIWLL